MWKDDVNQEKIFHAVTISLSAVTTSQQMAWLYVCLEEWFLYHYISNVQRIGWWEELDLIPSTRKNGATRSLFAENRRTRVQLQSRSDTCNHEGHRYTNLWNESVRPIEVRFETASKADCRCKFCSHEFLPWRNLQNHLAQLLQI